MNGYKWAVFALYAVSWLGTMLMIGKPRKPITPGIATVSTIISAGVLVLVYLS